MRSLRIAILIFLVGAFASTVLVGETQVFVALGAHPEPIFPRLTPECLTAAFTGGLLIVAICALVIANGQLRTVKDERTVSLIKEASSEEMERILGFFDFAADKRVSRRAFSDLFKSVISARSDAVKVKCVSDVAVASATALDRIVDEIREEIGQPTKSESKESQERELRKRIIAATNFFERVWTLVDRDAVDADMFLTSQSYNVVAVYYVLEEVLNDLIKHEEFNFDEFRNLAVRGQQFLDWLPADDPLRKATFAKLPWEGLSLRDTEGPTIATATVPS